MCTQWELSMTLFTCDGHRYDYVMLCLCMTENLGMGQKYPNVI